ncbi:hypothetical protein HZA87_05340 [Candidatus Uhrbacteria bacterium]|nr:hypothetical protein [Candidatus Uhrbacteria bacterium]
MKKKVIGIGLKDLSKSNRLMLNILMQEIADVRHELKEEMAEMRKELKGDIASVASELHTLRLEVHTNQTTFMRNHADLEKRVVMLETA